MSIHNQHTEAQQIVSDTVLLPFATTGLHYSTAGRGFCMFSSCMLLVACTSHGVSAGTASNSGRCPDQHAVQAAGLFGVEY